MPDVFGKADKLNDELRILMRRTEDLVSFTFKKGIDDPISFLTEFFSSELSLAQIVTLLIEDNSRGGNTYLSTYSPYYGVNCAIRIIQRHPAVATYSGVFLSP